MNRKIKCAVLCLLCSVSAGLLVLYAEEVIVPASDSQTVPVTASSAASAEDGSPVVKKATEVAQSTMQKHVETVANGITGSESGTASAAATSPFMNAVENYFTFEFGLKALSTLIIIFVIWMLYKLFSRAFDRIPVDKIKPKTVSGIQKGLRYLFYLIAVAYILNLFGVNLSAVWGAAGIAGVALGFAAQTSVSNIISGLFVIGERALKEGDFISVGDVSGTVDSLDLISVKVRTPDNQLIRVPNSTIINSNLKNASYYPYRRMNITVSVDYNCDMNRALEVLRKAALQCPHALKTPPADIWYDGFGDSGYIVTFGIWYEGVNYAAVRNEAFMAVSRSLQEAGISIPYPRYDVKIAGPAGGRQLTQADGKADIYVS